MDDLESMLWKHSYLHVRRCKCGAQIADFRAHLADAIRAHLADVAGRDDLRTAAAKAIWLADFERGVVSSRYDEDETTEAAWLMSEADAAVGAYLQAIGHQP